MEQYEKWEINSSIVEFYPEDHQYVVNGLPVPSITAMLKIKFGNKYDGISQSTLNRAASLGTAMHEAIQMYEEVGIDSSLVELRNYKFLKKQYNWKCLKNEIPVLLCQDGDPISCGRIDMLGEIDGNLGIFDFKRTSVLDRDYLAYQLNLYRLAFQQSYHTEIHFLAGVHLREDKRKLAAIAIDENKAYEIINTWRNSDEYNNFVGPDI